MSIVIYGFPTTGKTTLMRHLANRGYTAIDTDYSVGPIDNESSSLIKDVAFQHALRLRPDVILTNMGDRLLFNDIVPDFAFIRDDVDEVIDLMDLRGEHTVDRSAIESWLLNTNTAMESWGGTQQIRLAKGEFMLQYAQQVISAVRKNVLAEFDKARLNTKS